MTHLLIAAASLLALVGTLGLICWMLTINASDLGGWVERKSNLSQDSDNTRVSGEALISGEPNHYRTLKGTP